MTGHLPDAGTALKSERPAADRRTAPRRRVLKAGLMAFRGLHAHLPCALKDISQKGARLKIDATTVPPSDFTLIVEIEGTEVDCTAVWRRGRELGVTFTGEVRQGTRIREQVIQGLPFTRR